MKVVDDRGGPNEMAKWVQGHPLRDVILRRRDNNNNNVIQHYLSRLEAKIEDILKDLSDFRIDSTSCRCYCIKSHNEPYIHAS